MKDRNLCSDKGWCYVIAGVVLVVALLGSTAGEAKDLLWAGGHLAMGVCAAGSYASHGWPTRRGGAQAGKVEERPVVPNPKHTHFVRDKDRVE